MINALKRLGLVGLFAGLGLSTAACTDGFGYSGVGVGVAAGYGDPYYGSYGGGYADPYYGGYGYGGYGSYFGWYGDYYYPGTGVYVYDRYRRPYRWNDSQRRYWQGRRGGYRGGQIHNNWGGFGRDGRPTYGGDRFGRGDRPAYGRDGYRGDQSRDGHQGYRGGGSFPPRQDGRRGFRGDGAARAGQDAPRPGFRAGGATGVGGRGFGSRPRTESFRGGEGWRGGFSGRRGGGRAGRR